MKKIDNIIEILKALSDSNRYRILESLSNSGNNLCVTALSKKLNVSQPVISQHLKILKNANVVISKRMGYHIHYSINTKVIKNITDNLKNILDITNQNCIKEKCISNNN